MEPIAFAGIDGRIHLLDAPDQPPRCLAADRAHDTYIYTWPTWAPAADWLAVMALPRERGTTAVELVSLRSAAVRRVWSTDDGGPVFLYWAPDGRRLGLLVQEADTLHLLVADCTTDRPAERLASGAPLYWSWAADGAALALHVGGHYGRAGNAQLLLARLEAERPVWETLTVRPLGFRAPAWEPGTHRLAYAAAVGTDRRRLLLTDTASGHTEEVLAVGDEPAFVWAPQGRRLVLADERTPEGLYEHVALLDTQSGDVQPLPGGAAAVFWTPAGDALLRAVPGPAGDLLLWERLDLTDGTAWLLAGFSPTQELALLLGHFDQYAQAVRFYSQQEPALLFAHAVPSGRHNGRAADRAELWLAVGHSPVALRCLASGRIGFFAPGG
ncbi:MAG TPA: hypothetical protein VFB73_13005 [Chloroflexota bacterium]|nr:hypothetical protein [Chloroflexota bacterium]